MTVELWDNRTGNIVDAFEDVEQALALVRMYLAEDGADYVADLGLLVIDGFGNERVVKGLALVNLARQSPTSV
jgi:hypothetical protein